MRLFPLKGRMKKRARDEAQKTLGPKFDLKQFHEVLKEGAMPLTLLQQRIKERAAAQG